MTFEETKQKNENTKKMQKNKNKNTKEQKYFSLHALRKCKKAPIWKKIQVLDAAERNVGNFFVTKYMKIIKQTI